MKIIQRTKPNIRRSNNGQRRRRTSRHASSPSWSFKCTDGCRKTFIQNLRRIVPALASKWGLVVFLIVPGYVYVHIWSMLKTLMPSFSEITATEIFHAIDPTINFKTSNTDWEMDSLRIQKFFFQVQLLSDGWGLEQREHRECPKNKTYVMEQHDYGHFSSVHVVAHSFLQAIAFDYIFIPSYYRHSIISKARCESRALYGCMFEHIVGCQMTDVTEPQVKRKSSLAFRDLSWSKETEQKVINRLKERSGVKGNYGVGFYFAEAVKFVTRPNKALREHMDRMRIETIGETPLNRVLGVQMRLFGDKLGRFQEVTEESFAQAVVQLEMVQGRFDKIWVATNGGPKSVNNLRVAIQKYSGGDDNNRVVASPGKFWSANDLPQEKLADTALVLNYLLKNQNTSDWDEGLSLQAEITLISQCAYSIGNLESNVGRYMWEVQAAHHKTSQPPFFDVYGSLYFTGWAASPFPHKRLQTPQGEIQHGFKKMMGMMPGTDALQSCVQDDERNGYLMPRERTRENMVSLYPPISAETYQLKMLRDFIADAQHMLTNSSTVCRQYAFFQGLDPNHYTGLGARMRIMTSTFGYALNNGFAFTVPGPWHWTDEKLCPSRDHACYFQKPSGCDTERSSIDMTQNIWHYPQAGWQKLSERFHLPPFRINCEALFYLVQPNDRMVKDIEMAERLLDWHELPRPILTVHIRHGKMSHESLYYPTEDYLQAVEIMKKRHGFRSVFLVTDDRNATDTFETAIPNLGFEALVSLDAAKFEQSGWTEGNGAVQRDAHLRITNGFGNPCFEALSAMLNVYVGAKADGFVGTFNSNLGRMIVKLMYARNGVMLPNVSLDKFLSSADPSSCWQENICDEGRNNILVKTRSEAYPMTTSIVE